MFTWLEKNKRINKDIDKLGKVPVWFIQKLKHSRVISKLSNGLVWVMRHSGEWKIVDLFHLTFLPLFPSLIYIWKDKPNTDLTLIALPIPRKRRHKQSAVINTVLVLVWFQKIHVCDMSCHFCVIVQNLCRYLQ